MIPEIDLEETDADRAYTPVPGCCVDCDDELDFLTWQQEMTS